MRHPGVGWETRRLARLVGLLVLLAWAPKLLAQSPLPVPGDPAAGRRLFQERGCLRCHSIWGNGGTLGPDFAIIGAGRSMQQLAGLFWNHTPRMIETVRRRGFQWPTFTEQELANVISYVYYVKLFDEVGDPELGERWFREKRCVQCHSVGGTGGRVGPALDRGVGGGGDGFELVARPLDHPPKLVHHPRVGVYGKLALPQRLSRGGQGPAGVAGELLLGPCQLWLERLPKRGLRRAG